MATRRKTASNGTSEPPAEPLRIEHVRIDAVKEYSKNPRTISEHAVNAVARSIKEFGFRVPIILDRESVIVAGHTRVRAARSLGMTVVPAVRADDLTPEQAAALRIADNQLASLTAFDDDALALEIAALNEADFDLELLGFDDRTIDRLLAADGPTVGLTDPDEVPPVQADPVTQPGDLWIMGPHRLLCGDCTNPDDVKRVMDGRRAILFATDPPYLVDYDGTNHPHKWNERDKNKDWSASYGVDWDDAKANPDLFDKFIAVAVEHAILPDAAWYCWHASRRQAMLEGVWEKHGAFVHQQIIWAKDRPILTRSWYMWQHEPCLMGWVRPNKPPRVADDNPRSVWTIPTVPAGEQTDHPTSKPVELFAIPMRQHTLAGEVCYEPFAGSGSQIIAAEQLGRRCFAIEISPQYVDVCLRRWEGFTGKKAERVSAAAAPAPAPASRTRTPQKTPRVGGRGVKKARMRS